MAEPVDGRLERRWLLASVVLFNLAFLPYPWLPEAIEAWLPALLVVLAPAPMLAAFSRSGGGRRGLRFTGLWWATQGWWLVTVDPKLGVFAWLFMVLTSLLWGLILGAMLGRLRARCGPAGLLTWAPLAWCGWEMIRTWSPFGTAWGCLAHAWWKLPALLQPCELTGYRGISLVIAVLSAALARMLAGVPGARRQGLVGLGLLAACWAYGAVVEKGVVDDGRPIDVALVQANIPLDWKQLGTPSELFRRHLLMTIDGARGADLAVWPETAVPSQIFAIPEYRELLEATARQMRLTLVATGADLIPPDDPESLIWTNAAVVYGPDGRRIGHYHKVHLVILGEYMPFRNWPIFRQMAELAPQYYAGWSYHAVATPAGRLGLPICYESSFPHDVRKMVQDGAQLLCPMTNDDVLGQIGGRQHYQQVIFRAIELRRWIARSANCGISGFVDPLGRLHATTGWGEQIVLRGTARLRDGLTVYARWGDWLPWTCLILALAAPVRRGASLLACVDRREP